MQRPLYDTLKAHYSSNKVVKKPALFHEIGWDDLIENPAYDNTCAIRVSIALIKSGINVPGRIKIKSGRYKGKMIEPGQQRLAEILATKHFWGIPEKFVTKDAARIIGRRKGVIAFMRIPDYQNGRGGHIDLVSVADGGFYQCQSDCYWQAEQLWFWELE